MCCVILFLKYFPPFSDARRNFEHTYHKLHFFRKVQFIKQHCTPKECSKASIDKAGPRSRERPISNPSVSYFSQLLRRQSRSLVETNTSVLENIIRQLRWSRGSVLAFGTQVSGFKSGRSRRIFKGEKNPQHAFLRRGSKAVCPTS